MCVHLYSSVGYLGYFHVLAIVNNTSMKVGMHISFQISVFVSLGYIPRSGSAGSFVLFCFVFVFFFGLFAFSRAASHGVWRFPG